MATLKLYGPGGVIAVRVARIAEDAPASGAWTPDNLNADEISGGVEADDVTLRGLDWKDVRLFAEFSGTPGGTESVEIEPLIATQTDAADVGTRVWAALPKVTLSPNLDTDLAPIRGHKCAFRITSLALDGATDVTIKATGGVLRGE